MMDMLPCVVCSSDDLFVDEFHDKYQVVCRTCTTSTHLSYKTIGRAVFKWNCLIDAETDINRDVLALRVQFREEWGIL